jgi:hypothetical protein
VGVAAGGCSQAARRAAQSAITPVSQRAARFVHPEGRVIDENNKLCRDENNKLCRFGRKAMQESRLHDVHPKHEQVEPSESEFQEHIMACICKERDSSAPS